MNLEKVPFRIEHAQELLKPTDWNPFQNWSEPEWQPIADSKLAFTGLLDGSPIVCAGLIPQWPGRAVAWMITDQRSGPAMLWLHRQVSQFLTEIQTHASFRRIELTVLSGFSAGHRWAKMLGFKPEGLMKSYDVNGQNHVLFARVV